MPFVLLTDSSADLSAELVRDLDIQVPAAMSHSVRHISPMHSR